MRYGLGRAMGTELIVGLDALSDSIVVESEFLWPWCIRIDGHGHGIKCSGKGWVDVKVVGGEEMLACCWDKV